MNIFEEMGPGMTEEGKATLRMKQDTHSDNLNMYDLIAYRIKFTPHPHSGVKWCIYLSYDYAHYVVDSIKNVTHLLCTLEFEIRRVSYYWLYHALGIYQPYVWEYSRLNVTNTVMSKRKLNLLVTDNYVDGWDGTCLMNFAGLRRKGVTSTSINAFIRGIGITSYCSMIGLDRLEYHIREGLNKTTPRTMSCYIFSKHCSGYLRYAFPIKCTNVVLAENKETVLEIHAEDDPFACFRGRKVA